MMIFASRPGVTDSERHLGHESLVRRKVSLSIMSPRHHWHDSDGSAVGGPGQDGREVRSKMFSISSVVFDCRDDNYTWFTLWTQRNPGISLSQQLVAPTVARMRLRAFRREAERVSASSSEQAPFGF